jgi:hypothetical protein
MILEDVSFPVGATVEEKKVIYNEFIKKMLPRTLSICKNRVTQPMRDQFSGKLVFSWCLNMTVVELCFMNYNIVVCLKEDYGRVGAIDGAKLHDYIKTTTPEEFLKTGHEGEDDSPGSMLVNFLLRYATHSFHSKEEVRRLMNETRVRVIDENGQESRARVCFLDMMSKSDIAFCLWQYMNSEGDWTHKVLNRNKAGVNHSCQTKWTSDKSGTGKPVSDEGMAVYKEVYA